jgi:MFS transporter, DHA2 family, multidrug resistance protein
VLSLPPFRVAMGAMVSPEPLPGERANRREWLGLVALVLPSIIVAMDGNVLAIAQPHLVPDLNASATESLWIMDIYVFLVAGLLITMGGLGDRIGRRRLLLIGVATFGIASVIAAYTTSAGMLIAARTLLGAAGATLAPSTLLLIRNMFDDPRQRRVTYGIWTAGFSLGGVSGPLLGGVLLDNFWWESAFLVNVPGWFVAGAPWAGAHHVGRARVRPAE